MTVIGFGCLSSYPLLTLYHLPVYWAYPSALRLGLVGLFIGVLLPSVVAAIIESVSPSVYDNLYIPLSSIIVIFTLSQLEILGLPAFNLAGWL